MDLKSLMNSDSSEAARPSLQLQQQHHHQQQQQLQQQQPRNSIQPPPPRSASGSYASPPNPYAPKPTPPLYQHSSIDSRASNGGIPATRLTPLQTPTQTPGQLPGSSAEYPFPNALYQSPSQAQPYRTQVGYQVVTPGPHRPSAPSYQYGAQQNAPSPYGAPPPPAALHHSASHPSMSPTPPALHQQTPQAVRENSMSASQHYGHNPYSVNNQHPEQPSTPLGPPSATQYPRAFAHAQSPYAQPRHRTSSGASHAPLQSVISNSPAQYVGMESPATYGHPAQSQRALSGSYMSETDRERSVSVSPKTRVVPRQGSTGSYYSNQDAMSARNSFSAPQPEHDRLSHQIQPQHEPPNLRSSEDMSHGISPLTMTRPPPLQPLHAPPLAPSPSSRSSQTPKLKNILNDNNMASSPVRQSPAAVSTSGQSRDLSFQSHSHQPVTEVKAEPPPRIKTEGSAFSQEALLQQPVTASSQTFEPSRDSATDYGQQTTQAQLKRPAETEPESAHSVKRVKKRYVEPPIWARYVKSNPRYGNNPQSLAPPSHQLVKRPSPHTQNRANPPQQAQPNGHGPPATTNGTPSAPPSTLAPAIHPRLGPWEVNIKNVQPMSDLLREIGDFLYVHATRNDIGAGDARSGTLEIEAKLGTLIDRNTNSRIATMSRTNQVIDHAITQSGGIRFESFMTELQHKQMNEYLNKAAQASMAPDRVRMDYKHRYERDSFASLNRAGYEALPPSAKVHIRPGHSLKLRTSVDTKAPVGSPQAILGRIVKVRLDDLDIHCPKMDFDCRISVNVEVDLNNRPDVDPELIIDTPHPGDPDAPGDRMKDRLSYKHLAYSVDLTQVTLPGGKKNHELEIEVDTAVLRNEATRLMRGQDSGYETLVDGLLSNVLTLMKAQKDVAPMQIPPQQGR
ncbi:CYTH-like domain-containing protein [Delphinella strobiligena]|nr:CYTH-like domain-containing protein [Delphinella strobiligena]